MAEETPNPAAEEVIAVSNDNDAPKNGDSGVPEPSEEETKVASLEEQAMAQSISFKEETNLVGELPEPEKKALDELKQLVQEALAKHEFSFPPPAVKEEEKPAEETSAEEKVTEEKVTEEKVAEEPAEEKLEETKAEVIEEVTFPQPPPEAVEGETVAVCSEETVKETAAEEAEETAAEAVEVPAVKPEEVFLWGIPLLGDERSDVVLLKFLRARDFKAKEAFAMIKNTVKWRKEFGIESILEEDLGNELEKAVFLCGVDKEAHPVFYNNAFGAFQDKDLYNNCFADEEKRTKFLRWNIQLLEKSIRTLDFSPTGVSTFVHVNDFKNFHGLAKREIRQTTNQALHVLQDNYPEFVAKQVCINVSWWYLAFNRMISPFLTQRTKSKFVYAGPSKSAETLFRYVAPEQVPVQFGGMNRDGEKEFCVTDVVTDAIIKPSSKHTVEFPVSENCTLVWELRVIGWDVNYSAEFNPTHEEGYAVIVSKTRKISSSDEPIVSDSYKIGEAGKMIITIENQTSKKKKLLYRSKCKPLVE